MPNCMQYTGTHSSLLEGHHAMCNLSISTALPQPFIDCGNECLLAVPADTVTTDRRRRRWPVGPSAHHAKPDAQTHTICHTHSVWLTCTSTAHAHGPWPGSATCRRRAGRPTRLVHTPPIEMRASPTRASLHSEVIESTIDWCLPITDCGIERACVVCAFCSEQSFYHAPRYILCINYHIHDSTCRYPHLAVPGQVPGSYVHLPGTARYPGGTGHGHSSYYIMCRVPTSTA